MWSRQRSIPVIKGFGLVIARVNDRGCAEVYTTNAYTSGEVEGSACTTGNFGPVQECCMKLDAAQVSAVSGALLATGSSNRRSPNPAKRRFGMAFNLGGG